MIRKKTKRIRIDHELELTEVDVIKALRAYFPKLEMPSRCSLEVRVPTGGDYSGCTIEVAPLIVRWVEEKTETE